MTYKIRAVVDEKTLDDTQKAELDRVIETLGKLGTISVMRPTMDLSERGRRGAIGRWGTPDAPKPRGPGTQVGRPRVDPDKRSINPLMRRVWEAMPEDGWIKIAPLAKSLGIPPMNCRAALCLLKERGFAKVQDSKIRTGGFVEWSRAVEELPA